MKNFKVFLDESANYVCKCLRRHATVENYEKMRNKHPDLTKEEFFSKFKEFIRDKTNISTCLNHCEKPSNTHKFTSFYKNLS